MAVGLWSLVLSTDIVSKIVLLILLGMSIVCWALVIYKRMLIKAKLESLLHAKNLLKNTKGMDDFLTRVTVIQATYAGELITGFCTDFKKIARLQDAGLPITEIDWTLLQNSMSQRVDDAMSDEESLIPVLITSTQSAPLLGLFGTVWGLIHAFQKIAEQRTADIAAVAPGIAEALITTLGGLLVAIPGLVLISYLYNNSRILEQELGEITDICGWIMRAIVRTPVTPVKSVSVSQPERELQ